ncbi:hypothetical protein SGRI78S_02393 [Streptomyces griseus subsp. griseus]
MAFRSIGVTAPGSENTAERVVTHIPFNFASQATHPFLRTLDDVKRISKATDGLGELAILQMGAAEATDHPDYGGNYNKRAGGLKDLNTLLKDGEKWGADFGVHVNATESYPEAKAFSEQLVDKTKPGWNWLNQSYYIDQRRDINSGDLEKRFRQLRDETHRNLDFLYIDVYYSHGWIADKTIQAVQKQGWTVGTEWADKFERASLWSHWANDLNYGGATNKGLNSQDDPQRFRAGDLDWTASQNGWGPVERDRSNGEAGPAGGPEDRRRRLRQGPGHPRPGEDPLLPGREVHLLHRRGGRGRRPDDPGQCAVLGHRRRYGEGGVTRAGGGRPRLEAHRRRHRREVRRADRPGRRRRQRQRPRGLGRCPLPLRRLTAGRPASRARWTAGETGRAILRGPLRAP